MNSVLRRLSAAIVVGLVAQANGAFAASGEALGPAERLHTVAGELSAVPAVGMTAEGRRIHAYLAEVGGSVGVWGRMSLAPSWMTWSQLPAPWLISEGTQMYMPAIAVSKYGFSMAAWIGSPSIGAPTSVVGRLFGANGSPSTEALVLNTTQAAQYSNVAATSDYYGSIYLVAWKSLDSGQHHIRGRVYNSSMVPNGGEFQIDAGSTDFTMPFAVAAVPYAALGSEKAYAAWIGPSAADSSYAGSLLVRSIGQYGQLGPVIELAAQSNVDGVVTSYESPSLAFDVYGTATLVWKEVTSRSSGADRRSRLLGRHFDSQFQNLGPIFEVAAEAPFADGLMSPQVAADSQDGVAVSWSARSAPGGQSTLMLRRFNAWGAPIGEAVAVTDSADGEPLYGRIASDADGDLSLVWTQQAPNGDVDAMERRYRGQGLVQLNVSGSTIPESTSANSLLGASLDVANLAQRAGSFPSEGINAATGVALELHATGGAEILSVSGQNWECANGAPVSCTYLTDVPAQQSAQSLSIELRAPEQTGEFTVAATVLSEQDDAYLADNSYVLTSRVVDLTPDPILFNDVADVEPGALVVSNPVTLSGFSEPLDISTANGEYSLNGGAFSTSPGVAYSGDLLQLRHLASSQFSTTVTTLLSVGESASGFSSMTRAADLVPLPFQFASISNVALAVQQTSDEIVVQGIDAPTAISVSNGSYSIDGGAFTSAAGQVNNGQHVRVRHTSASDFSTSTQTTLDIGGVSAQFVSTTVAMDTVPDAFAFASVTEVELGSAQTSAAIVVAGINAPAPIAVTGGSYSVNGGAFTTIAGQVNAGDSVRLRHLAASSHSETVTSALTIGGVSAQFSSTTLAADSSPDAFTFSDLSGVRRSRYAYSNAVTISGINVATPIAVSGGGSYSINGGSFTTAAGLVRSGDQVQLSVLASSRANTTINTTLSVGDKSDVWSVTTGKK